MLLYVMLCYRYIYGMMFMLCNVMLLYVMSRYVMLCYRYIYGMIFMSQFLNINKLHIA